MFLEKITAKFDKINRNFAVLILFSFFGCLIYKFLYLIEEVVFAV